MRTIIYDSIEPLTPIRDPTVVNNGLSSMKPTKHRAGTASVFTGRTMTGAEKDRPSATSANPEYAFSTVMTTASADPRYQSTPQRRTLMTTYAYPPPQQPQSAYIPL